MPTIPFRKAAVIAMLVTGLLESCGSPNALETATAPPTPQAQPPGQPAASAASEASPTPDILTERPGPVRLFEAGMEAGYLHREFLQIPVGLAWGPDNKLYIGDWTGRHVVRVDKDGSLDDLSFWKTVPALQDDGPRGVAFDSEGNLYVNNHRSIFRISPDGSVTELAGIEGRPVGGIAISPTDELFYTDRAAERGGLKKWQEGKSVTVAENIPLAENIVFGLDGIVYLTPMGQGQILKIDVGTGTVTTFQSGVCGNDPTYLAVDKEGDLWARGINCLEQFSPDGVQKPFIVDGQAYPGGPYLWHTAAGIAFDDEGGLWIGTYNSRLIRLAPTSPGAADPEFTLQMVAPGFEASDLEAGPQGEIYASDENHRQILRFSPDGGKDVILDHGMAGRIGLAVDVGGTVYVGLPNGEIVRIEADGTATHYASLTARRMAFGADGALYAIAGDWGQVKSIVRITDVDTYEVVTGEIGGAALGGGESHISPALDTGFYIYTEDSCDLLYMDFNGEGRLITNIRPLGCGGPAIMAASPTTGDIFVIAHGPYRLYRIAPDGEPTPIAEGIFGDPWGMAVSRDGQWLYVAESGAINKIRLSGGNP